MMFKETVEQWGSAYVAFLPALEKIFAEKTFAEKTFAPVDATTSQGAKTAGLAGFLGNRFGLAMLVSSLRWVRICALLG